MSPIRNFDSKVPEYSYSPGESTSQTYHLRYIILLLLVFLLEKKTLFLLLLSVYAAKQKSRNLIGYDEP